MNQGPSAQFFSKKAFEISYALFRVSAALNRRSFAERLEDVAVRLLESAVASRYSSLREKLNVIVYLVRLGSDNNVIHPANAQVIIREAKNLDSAVSDYEKSAKPEEAEIETVFSKERISKAKPQKRDEDKTPRVSSPVLEEPILSREVIFQGAPRIVSQDVRHEEEEKEGLVVGRGGNEAGFQKVNHEVFVQNQSLKVGAQMRQSAIFEKIRQTGNCRLKDIQEALPKTSERTIRYDLQSLLQEKRIQRIGSGGPATYYRLPD